ncbi:MAG: alkaline phosphatase family protein [Erysipelotrichaceae bacterium]|nr:alkaline phosphatase family protein [Erysipelotrichaceae bacterium]
MIVYYDESILTYVASIRNYFGLTSSYPANEALSALLNEKRPEKIFLMLIDAMGSNLIERKLPEDSFLRKHMTYVTTTVFPSTTTAATTAIRNGRAPNENAWLGWCQYLKEADDIIVPLRSCSFYEDRIYPGDIMNQYVPVSSTENELNRIGIKARNLYPSFREDGCEDFDEMCGRLIRFSNDEDFRYIYAYWDKYDSYMHKHGPSSKICDAYLNFLDREIENLAENLAEDTMLIVTADHGQVDTNRVYNLYGSPFDAYFSMRPSIEPRAMTFFIKEGMQEEFAKKFKETFENDYVLLTHRQVLETRLFGDHENHPRFEEFVGDFLAIAKSDLVLDYSDRPKNSKGKFGGMHAGMCEDELMIPVITYMT